MAGIQVSPRSQESWARVREVRGAGELDRSKSVYHRDHYFLLERDVFPSGRSKFLIGLAFLIVGGLISLGAFFQDNKSNLPWIAPEVVAIWASWRPLRRWHWWCWSTRFPIFYCHFYFQSYNGMSAFYSGLIIMLQSVTMLCTTPLPLFGRSDQSWIDDRCWPIDFDDFSGRLRLFPWQPGHVADYSTDYFLNGIGMAIFLSPNNADHGTGW